MTPFDPSGAEPPFDAPVSNGVLPSALACPPGAGAVAEAAGARSLPRSEAVRLFETGPVIVAHASLTARRLGLGAPPRAEHLFDALELFAFVRPAKFCAPSAVGLAPSAYACAGQPAPLCTP